MLDYVEAALDRAFHLSAETGLVRAGPLTGSVAAPADIGQWLESVLPGEGKPDFATALLATDEPIFRQLIPAAESDTVIVEEDGFMAMWQPAPSRLFFSWSAASRRGMMWSAEPEPPPWILSRPLLPMVHAAAVSTSWLPVHAAAVGRNGRFLALAGNSKAGKSTASLMCAQAGWEFAGDDFIMVDADNGDIEPLYTSARVRATAPPELRPLIDETIVSETDKSGELSYELRLAPHDIGNRIRGGRIAAWLLPRRQGAKLPVFELASKSAAYVSLVTVTTMSLPFARGATAAKVLRMIGKAPTYFVDTGTDPHAIAPAFDEFLARLTT